MFEIVDNSEQVLKKLLSRRQEPNEQLSEKVQEILRAVRRKGDQAVFKFTAHFDGCRITEANFRVTPKEIEDAYRKVEQPFLVALQRALNNIYEFHCKQKEKSWNETYVDGSILGQLVRPLERVGIYVPGGTASYPSSVLMNAIPARVAGVKEIIMVTPPDTCGLISPYTLVAAAESKVDAIFKVGGAQGVAALAYGTAFVPKVDKITGPGNIYVTEAKRQVYGEVDIDMLAGPSEVLIIADADARADFVAADLLSQAEHDPLATSILITPSRKLAEQVKGFLKVQITKLPRYEIARRAIEGQGLAIITPDLEEALKLANAIAPEHLELAVNEPLRWLGKVNNAGAVFLGTYTSETVGDYLAGPNHILPTAGTARFYSPLGVSDFLKRMSVVYYTEERLKNEGPDLIKLTEVEGLEAHGQAIRLRLDNRGKE